MLSGKKWMTEEDVKLRFITPAIQAKWGLDRITMETRITDGRINLKGNSAVREKPKKADYILYLAPNKPIAVVEAKDNNHSVSHGLQQAITYARMLDVPFAYSSNGDAFQEHDLLTGLERTLPPEDFPSIEELAARWEKGANGGKGLSADEKKVIAQPYYSSQTTYEPRYYQRNAVNRAVEAIARGRKRLLLAMATGTGKTYTAFQIVWRLLQSGMRKKVLYLADRNNLVDQSIQQDFAPLEKTIHKVNFAKDDPRTITSHEVFFSLYQQLAGDEENGDGENGEEAVARLARLFKPEFFDLVFVDECHRGSAKKDSTWRKILDYFSSATQIGMTATPKETRYVSNIDYFGEPVYAYSLREGIEDGFLAPFKVVNVKTDISDGWRPCHGQRNKFGNPIEDRIYSNSDFDYNIVLEDRTEEVAREITRYLKSTGRMQKTIVFCANEDHAERMRIALNNLNADMAAQNPDYVVRITGSDTYGKSKLDYFISVSAPYPVIATTSKLLSTGADCKMVKLIVLDEMIGSMTEFKQIIGRGTRLREREGKRFFVVMDFRNITRLFADPEWDGPVEQDDGYGEDRVTVVREPSPPAYDGAGDTSPAPGKCVVDVDGCSVHVIGKRVEVYDTGGRLLRQESIVDYTKTNILGRYASLDNFIRRWTAEDRKDAIRELLLEQGIDLGLMKAEEGMAGVDDFDFICHVAFDQKPLTRRERAENVKKRDFLSRYGGVAREVLEALLDRYMDVGIYEIEKPGILQLDPFRKFGKPARIAGYFGGKEGYLNAVRELEREIYGGVA